MTNFKKQYRDLEMQVLSKLKDLVNTSSKKSNFVSSNAIKVNVFDYEEMVILDDRLLFIDNKGLYYSLFCDCSLEDLIDILNSQ